MGASHFLSQSCWLRGYAHPCGGRTTGQHLINKSKIPANIRDRDPRLAELVDSLLVPVCLEHNSGSKMADAPEARAILLQQLLWSHPEQTYSVFEEIHQRLKVPIPELTIDSILDHHPIYQDP